MKEHEPKKRAWETATYTDSPDLPELDQLKAVKDFLPRPEELVFRPKSVKVTITLSEESVTYFKQQGERLQTPYQRMIRNLIDEYVRRMRQDDPNLGI